MVEIIIKIDGEEVSVKTEERKSEDERKLKEVLVFATSIYARFFDETCAGWTKDSEANLVFLRSQQDYCNVLLKAKGNLFLNEVYDILGMPRTKAGHIVGWIYDEGNPIGDNFVDFDLYSDRNRDFINGYNNAVLLDFNVDGGILSYL